MKRICRICRILFVLAVAATCAPAQFVDHGVPVPLAEKRGATLTLRVPALAGSYEILINVVENQAPKFCRLAGSARGPAGGVQGEGTFMVAPDGQKTVIAYDGEAQLTGPLGGMHPRFAEGVAQTLIQQGLNKLAELARARQGSPS